MLMDEGCLQGVEFDVCCAMNTVLINEPILF